MKRPSQKFIPNGCGPAAAGPANFVPDSVLGVEFGDECCNLHDLEYHIGGFWGLFTRKPRADFGLGACMVRRMISQGRKNWDTDSRWTGAAQMAAAVPLGTLYTVTTTAFGWLPFIWSWRKRPVPSHEALEALGQP